MRTCQSALARLDLPTERIAVSTLQDALRSRDSDRHPICMSYGGADAPLSLASAVMVLGEDPELFLSMGAPDEHPYLAYRFGS